VGLVPVKGAEELHDSLFPTTVATGRHLNGERCLGIVVTPNSDSSPTIINHATILYLRSELLDFYEAIVVVLVLNSR
jgi:hypothetical protein